MAPTNWHQLTRCALALAVFTAGVLGLSLPSAQAVVFFEDDFDSYNNVDDTELLGVGGWSTEMFLGDHTDGHSNPQIFHELTSQWTITNLMGRGNPSSLHGEFTTGNALFADSDGANSEDNPGSHTNYAIFSPIINVTGNSATLHVDISGSLNNNGYTGFIIESTSNASAVTPTWTRLFTALGPGRLPGNPRINGNCPAPGCEVDDEFADNFAGNDAFNGADIYRGRLDLNLPASAANNNDVQIRFIEYEPNDDWWISFDNVKVDDVQRLTSGSTTVFEQDFNALDGTLGAGANAMVNLEVTQSTTSMGREAWQTVDQSDLEPGKPPVYIFNANQIVKPMEGVGINRLGHPTEDLSNSSFLPFAISEGYLSTSGAQGAEAVALGPPAPFEQVLATQVLDLSGLSEVILEYDREGYGSDFKARVVLREVGIDSIQDTNDAVVAVVYDDNLARGTVGAGADHDGNGSVNGFDFLIQQRGFGADLMSVTHATGDTNGDKVVDRTDIAAFEAQFGGAPIFTTKTGGYLAREDPMFASRIFSVPEAVGRNDVYFAWEYGSDLSDSNGDYSWYFAVDNVKVSGNPGALAVATPEPGSLFLAIMGTMACAATLRRRLQLAQRC